MSKRDIPEHLFPTWREGDKHAPLIRLISMALDEITLDEPVYQLYHTVMRDLEPLGKSSDGWLPFLRQPLDGKEQLMLLRFKARSACYLFAKAQEATKLITKFGQYLILRDEHCISGIHRIGIALSVKHTLSLDPRVAQRNGAYLLISLSASFLALQLP
jgi:hypothetical protein